MPLEPKAIKISGNRKKKKKTISEMISDNNKKKHHPLFRIMGLQRHPSIEDTTESPARRGCHL
ncbi:hypothetical protein DIU31_027615 [Mucilaginibacter rubeus]|uniref:Uncharacterized protein n=1 Tax=Mucilaginibacter rubeus TaxID=2027860 RepID=A0AAE6JJM5_9SPHI|nr:hypothetical protein [Mucilaginibacter rubeus]QEM07089.1 hypothetical protein DIU31_027615 [Mucilaginibacter rubeus]QTE43769.1 hypothetical protein J3L19_33455 [Mucilaginibacter rubeus]QTE50368.1 hypothetical protein J3L21_33410 [Mucilaginibacter rubeus]QTE55455.1 hypothetical protein J3L23_25025 [Mucilaginibacter rubeus]QTE65083.1 hypothetical protein J3L22_08795 [Mucilaginibacter rubeus]